MCTMAGDSNISSQRSDNEALIRGASCAPLTSDDSPNVQGNHLAKMKAGYRQRAHGLQVAEQAYLAALRQVPIITEERLRVVMAAQVQLAQVLATMGWEHKQLVGTFATFNADLLRALQHIALMLHIAQTASSALGPAQVLERVADA
jgi:hypothetical protein